MEWFKEPIKWKKIGTSVILILIFCLAIHVAFPTWLPTIRYFIDEINVDKDISSQYVSQMKPIGEEKILAAVNNASKLNNTEAKLNSILEWELQDWVNPRWGFPAFTCYDPACRYFYFNNDSSKIRQDVQFPLPLGSIYFPNDPAWIAYHKTGACQEISVLFAETASRAGYQTHTVYWLSHQWPEVNIDGEWWYYDPVCAYEKYQLNTTNSSMWFNKTKNFRTNCYSEAVVVFDAKNWYDFTPTYRYYF